MAQSRQGPRAAWRQRLGAWVESPRVAGVVIALIVANAVVLGLETIPGLSPGALRVLLAIDATLLAVFVVEIALKLVAHGRAFFRSAWNVFDLVVVGIALVPAGQGLGVLRALRVLRVLRLVSMVPSMRKVVAALLGALPGMGSIVALLALVMYVAAVMATKLFGASHPQYFGDLGASLFTLFQVMTVEGWPDIAREVMAVHAWAWVFFVVYLVAATFTVLNLFIAVIVNAMQSQVDSERAAIESMADADADRDATVLGELRALRAEVAALHERLGPASPPANTAGR